MTTRTHPLGFLQIRDTKNWMFVITAFGTNDCQLLNADGTETTIPIDAKNQITVDGRLYTEEHWHH